MSTCSMSKKYNDGITVSNIINRKDINMYLDCGWKQDVKQVVIPKPTPMPVLSRNQVRIHALQIMWNVLTKDDCVYLDDLMYVPAYVRN